MALSQKQKNYIQKNKTSPAKTLADKLNLSEDEVQQYLNEITTELTSSQSRLFTILALSIPVLFFVILEVLLQLANYKGNLDLFIIPDDLNGEYVFPNPDYAKRYFFNTNVIPNPSRDSFLKDKPQNGFRVFVMGGSSAVGYPYGFNIKFSKIVELTLKDLLPDKKVEVVNMGTSAVNSYTLYDQVDEILEYEPDAIMIYAGHNEFYGALGVGSSESLGAFPGFVRFYLKIQRLKTFLVLRDMISWFVKIINGSPSQSGTLMERVVKEQEILLNSELYKLGLNQFNSNLSVIIDQFTSRKIPVYIGSLASNYKDHEPFISKSNDNLPAAETVYLEAQQALSSGNIKSADSLFVLAKDLDALRFRASTELNEMIKGFTSRNLVHYVPSEEFIRKASPNGIIGNEMMLEHLHPNVNGYVQLGDAFVESFINNPPAKLKVESKFRKPLFLYERQLYVSDLDTTIANLKIQKLKSGWPFVKDGTRKKLTFNPKNKVDSLAMDVVNGNKVWEPAKVEIAGYYTKTKQFDKAINEYKSIIVDAPYSVSAHTFASKLLIQLNRNRDAKMHLEQAYQLEPDAYITKMLGSIEVNDKNYNRAISLLNESIKFNASDPQAWYNLSGAYALNKMARKAYEAALKVYDLNPKYPGIQNWIRQLEVLKNREK